MMQKVEFAFSEIYTDPLRFEAGMYLCIWPYVGIVVKVFYPG